MDNNDNEGMIIIVIIMVNGNSVLLIFKFC